ncbi:kinase-like protein [Rhizophagus irregularis]|uniref:Kinase-like protein n=1 Tax=Rhizophagus irregularis TaxID=588596 RepID=A0A2I1GLE5_9GLOM|nr:kinase-like protein [Rhizophagus irregularis]
MIDKFDHDKFIKRELIREGGFGLIYSAEWDERREKVILKYVKSNSNIRKFIEEVRNFNKEMRIHQMVSDHDNIIPFYGMAQDLNNQQFAMVLQYADGGSLREYLEYNKDLTWFDKLRFAQEITKGILWIHDKKIIHRDLHSNNILVHQRKIKISDFGLSEMIDHSTRSFVGGIPAYMEPQLFISNEYCLDEKSDVYSLGVLMWEISSGQPPFNFKSPEQVISLITNNKREMPIYGTPIKYVSLYRECWQQDPQLRPTTEEVFNKLESIPIDSVIETQTLRDNLNPGLTANIDSLLNGTSNLSLEDEECDDGVKELDINDL